METMYEIPTTLLRTIRSSFAGLEDGRLFFNNAAGAMRLKAVMELQRELTALPDYPSGGAGEPARRLLDAMEEGKRALRLLLDAPEGGQIVQDLSPSRLLFSLADAAARCGRGKTIVTTELDHPAAVDGARRAAEKYSMGVTVVPADRTIHSVTAEQVLAAVKDDTAVLMMTCTSNTTGAQLPYGEIVRAARTRHPGLYILLDGVQRLPHGPVGLRDVPVDAVVVAPYKVFSARGSGLAWVSDRLDLAGRECLVGQSGSTWSLGSVDPVSFALMKPVADYFQQLGRLTGGTGDRRALVRAGQEYAEERERALHWLMLEGTERVPGLWHIPGVRIWFDQEELGSKDWIVCISGADRDTGELYQDYLRRGVVLSVRKQDSIYCGTLLQSYGCGDILRVSPMHYHSREDVLRFLDVTKEIFSR